MKKHVAITVRMPKEWIPRLDQIAETLGRVGTDGTRSLAIRYALSKGLDAAEAARRVKRSPPRVRGSASEPPPETE